MPSTSDLDGLKNQRAKLIENVIGALGPEALADPNLPEVVGRLVDQRLATPGGFSMNGSSAASQYGRPAGQPLAPTGQPAPPTDGGLADLIGLGATAPADLAQAEMSPGVVDYDDTVTSDRLLATADLYYQYVHERLGVFDVIYQLQGCSGPGQTPDLGRAGCGRAVPLRQARHPAVQARGTDAGVQAGARLRPGRAEP